MSARSPRHTGDLAPGFSDPVGDAQCCFRALLDAMARPGTVVALAAAPASPPAPLAPATAAALLTLADKDTPLWMDDATAHASAWIAFHCGPPAAPIDKAAFACAVALPDFNMLRAGDHETPEQSATVIFQADAFGRGTPFVLRGPGIEREATLLIAGLPADFPTLWARNRALYPRGVDLIICAGREIAALPRSVAVGAG